MSTSVFPGPPDPNGDEIVAAIGNPKQSRRSTRTKRSETVVEPKIPLHYDPLEYAPRPLSQEERDAWKGWCEIESDPAFFNVMLRDFGISGIKVHEIFSLDEEMVAFLPKPIYGLVFLYQFQDDDLGNQEPTSPDNIWFANQTITNACGTIALLNIILNIPKINLGETLQCFKDFTQSMSPPLRGYTVGNHDFLRKIHNSFARRMDTLSADLSMSNSANARTSQPSKVSDEEDQAGYHYIAFVPILGSVWKLNGLERQPTNLGTFEGDWMEIVRPSIQEQMQQYEGEQIQFNLLSLCRSPLEALPQELAENVRTLQAIETRLKQIAPEWEQFIDNNEESGTILYGCDANFQISEDLLDAARPSPQVTSQFLASPGDAESLLALRQEVIFAQSELKAAFLDEAMALQQDSQRAASRRHDYTPMIHIWLRMLAEKGVLETLATRADCRS
ncbi:MAG: hypothetical protein M1818_003127 [Claussenomyces sp. TS43310]|nr:MAG: hypothetical protein M1818_003127 [Claussenomyces sp. TS43310]